MSRVGARGIEDLSPLELADGKMACNLTHGFMTREGESFNQFAV